MSQAQGIMIIIISLLAVIFHNANFYTIIRRRVDNVRQSTLLSDVVRILAEKRPRDVHPPRGCRFNKQMSPAHQKHEQIIKPQYLNLVYFVVH